MQTVAYKASVSRGKIKIEESGNDYIESAKLNELFAFLIGDIEDDAIETICICWNLDNFTAVLLQIIEEGKCLKLSKTHKAYLPPFNIFYIPGKVLSVTHIPSNKKQNFYHLEQYFPELEEPKDVEELKMLGDKLLYELGKMKLHPTKLTSPVAIYDECKLSQMDLPTANDMPTKAIEYAARCSGRLWIESHQIGYWENIYDYDLSSAFPNIAKDLYDIRQCKWVHSNEFQADALYGYAKVKVTIYPHVTVSPIMTEVDDKQISPTGTWEDWYTLHELKFIKEHNIGEWRILDGYFAIPIFSLERLRKPLLLAIEELLKYRKNTGLQSALAKRMAAGIYGKFGEERLEGFGKHFNPCYFAEISTDCRLKVAEFLYLNQVEPLHVGVDGVMLEQPATAEKLDDQWRLSYTGEALIISSGLVYTKTTRPKGLTLPVVKNLIKEHPGKAFYSTKLRRRLTLGDAVAQKRLDEVGTMIEVPSSIYLTKQKHDRNFPKLPQTGQQLLTNKYSSKPFLIGED